jgi:hypothetical protein
MYNILIYYVYMLSTKKVLSADMAGRPYYSFKDGT